MKKYLFIFSFLLVFILLGAACVNAAEIDDSDSIMLENEDMGLSQGDNIGLNYENEILSNNDDEEVSQGETNSYDDLQEEAVKDLDSVDDELFLDDSAGLVGSVDDELFLDDSVDFVASADEGIETSSQGEFADESFSLEENSQTNIGDSLPDVVCYAENLEDFQLFILFMETWDTPSGEILRQKLNGWYQIEIPKEHSNTLRLKYDIATIKDKLKISLTQGKDITIDGQGHTINLKGSSKHDHYFIVKSGHVTFQNIKFTNGYNKDGDNGGAISFEDNAVGTVINCSFFDCYAEDAGGAIADRSGNTLTIINSTFKRNFVDDGHGGAIWSNGKLILTNSTFEENLACDEGTIHFNTAKGLAVCAQGLLIIDGSTFMNHDCHWEDSEVGVLEAPAYGTVYAKELQFTNATSYFYQNFCEKGGAIYAKKITGEVSHAFFIANFAYDAVGAIYVDDECEVNFSECVFAYNIAYHKAGAVYMDDDDSHVSFTNCIFIRNNLVDGTNILSDTIAYTKGDLYAHQNWYGSFSGEEDFKQKFIYKSNKKFVDSDYYQFFSDVRENVDYFDFEMTFKTKSGEVPSKSLFLSDIWFYISEFKQPADITNITYEKNTIKAKIVPKGEGEIVFVAQFYKAQRRAISYYTGVLVDLHTLYVHGYDPNLIVDVNDVIYGEEDGALVEVHLNETINRTVEVEYNNQTFLLNVVNGYGNMTVYNLSCGTYTVIVTFNKTIHFKKAQYVARFEVKPKTTPDDVFEFTTLQNKVNHAGDCLVLDKDYMYSSVNDIDFKDGVVVSKDNFVIDGQGHTIDGQNLARVFNVTGVNVTIKNINFINGSSEGRGGAIYFYGMATVEGSNFTGNSASSGSAIYSEGDLTVRDSSFLDNKAGLCDIDMYVENHNVVIEFLGNNFYLNAISTLNHVSFENVTYWNGSITSISDVDPEMVSPGMNVTVEVYRYGSMELVKNFTVVTGNDGKYYYNTADLDLWDYLFVASHLDDSYYPFASLSKEINLIYRNSSSVSIDLADNAEFTYPSIPKNISFNIVNCTNDVWVNISDKDGHVVFSGTIEDGQVAYDEASGYYYISIESLALGRDYYNVTVYNMANADFDSSKDSKLFRLLKAGSSIVIDEVEPFNYPSQISFTLSGDNITSFNVTIYDGEGNVLYAESNVVASPYYPTVELHPGQYLIEVVNNGDESHFEAEDAKIFVVNRGLILADLYVDGNVIYGDETVFHLSADKWGKYTLEINGVNRTVELEKDVEFTFGMLLPADAYLAVLRYDDPDYDVTGENSVEFNVYPRPNTIIVEIIDGDVFTYEDKVIVKVTADIVGNYSLEINGSSEGHGRMVTVEVNNESDGKYFGFVEFDFLDADTYSAKVICDDSNYNLTIVNATFTVNKGQISNEVDVDAESFVGYVYMVIRSERPFGYYTIEIDGKERSVAVADGIGSTSFALSEGTYTAHISFEDSNFEISTAEVTFDVPGKTNTVNVSVEDVTYPDSVLIVINADVDGLYNLSVGGYDKVVLVENGFGNTTVFLDAGNYSTKVSFENPYCITVINDADFEVLKGTRNVSVRAADVVYGNKAVIFVDSNVDGVYILNVSGDYYFVNLVDGMGNLSLLLDVGTYSVGVVLDESPNFDDNVVSCTFRVKKQDAVISAKNRAYVINYGGTYEIVLKDASGNPLSGKRVTFVFAGRSVGSAVTNAKGIARIKLSAKMLKVAKAGKRNLVIKFAGDGRFNAVSRTVKVTVSKEKTRLVAKKKAFRRAKKVKRYAVKLKNSKGKAVKKVKVTLRVKGKTYKAKTNNKGRAVFKIKNLRKRGKYLAKIKFKGNKYYKASTKKVKITVKK